MRWIFLLLTSLFITETATASVQPDPFRRVLHRQELTDLGISRPADIFNLLPEWNQYRIDGFTQRAAAGSLDHFGHQRWLLMVDGRVVETSMIETLALNTLPITVSDIDSVVISHRPSIESGYFSERGTIHIHTRKASPGIDIGATIYTGNEINDPGPYHYTNDATPNIDRIGPDFGGFLRVASGNFFAGGTMVVREHHATDGRIEHRTRNLHDNNNHSPRLMLSSQSIVAGHQNTQGNTLLSATHSYFKDFGFVLPYGSEIPFNQTYSSVSLQSGYQLSPQLSYNLNAVLTEDHYNQRENDLHWDPAIKMDYFRSRGFLVYHQQDVTLKAGAGYDRFGARPFYDALQSGSYFVPRVLVGASIAGFSIDADVAFTNGEGLPKIIVQYQSKLNDQVSIYLGTSYNRQSGLEENRVAYWIGQGYKGFDRVGLWPENYVSHDITRRITADAGLNIRPSENLELRISAAIRHLMNGGLLSKAFVYDSIEHRFTGDLTYLNDLGGLNASAAFGVRHTFADQLTQEFNYHLQTAVSGGEVYLATQRTLPKHTLLYSARYTPVSSFSIGFRARIQSATEWSDFYVTKLEETPGFDGPVVPVQIQTGLFVRKNFLYDRVFIAFGLDNALNQPNYSWPGGEMRDMVFEVSAGASLQGWKNRRSKPVYDIEREMQRPFY